MAVTQSHAYWLDMEQEVAERVRAGLVCNAKDRAPTLMFLRNLEEEARGESDRAQTIQIIASGRRLLGDRSNLGRADGRYVHCLGKHP